LSAEAEQKNFLFLLEEKIGARKIKNREENFSARHAAAKRRLAAGRSETFHFSKILGKISSSLVE